MATSYKTPGVYIEEIPKLPPSVAQVETAIPAFIGYTAFATDEDGSSLTLVPKRIVSLLEYEQFFGKPQSEKVTVTIADTYNASDILIGRNISAALTATPSRHVMYYQLQMYFANGGGPCYIVSVGVYLAHGTAIDASATSALKNGLDALEKADEPTLIVFPELAGSGDTVGEINDLYDLALAQCAKLGDRFAIIDCAADSYANVRHATDGIGMNNLKYGAVYHPFLKTALSYFFDDNQVTIAQTSTGGTPPAPPFDGDTLDLVKAADLALYNQVAAKIGDLKMTLPPSATVAGVYAAVDSSRGVWKAPANVSITLVSGLTKTITNTEQDGMNVDVTAGKSINAIRAFTGKGILVWGARTLAGNDNEWRYVSVRRFFNMVEESTKKASEPFVFEPNDANTWVKVQSMVENFLTNLWRQGALQGAKPEHAFYVAVGLGKTMTAVDILEGRMIVEIGMAVVRPAEFIILRFSHKMAES
jgi:phage tail sheath protein FI